MIHLTDDELIDLAEVTEEMQVYKEHQLIQMEHLKTCKECYDKFCSALALADLTSESGYMLLSQMYHTSTSLEAETSLGKKTLAVVNVIRKKVGDSVTAVLKQVEQASSIFCFEEPLAVVTRSIENEIPTISSIEEADDEKTFILFDTERKELLVQVNMKNLNIENMKIYLLYEEENKEVEIPIVRKGNIVQGILCNVEEKNFIIYIVQK